MWYNTVRLYKCICRPQDGLEMFLRKCPSPHAPGDALPSLLVPRTPNISSSVSTTLQNNQSSSYTLMSLYIDLIEHTVDKVLRNPLGASPLPSNLWSLYSNPHHFLTVIFFFLFVLSLHSIISFPPPISLSIFPLLSIHTLHCFLTSLLLLFPFNQSSCVPVWTACTY